MYYILFVNLLLAAKADHSQADCFSCAILSHGDELHVVDKRCPGTHERLDVVYATDQIIPTRDIVDMFTDHMAPTLANKPRLFFIQVNMALYHTIC